jgi:HD-like signal output (HDOD) protein
MSTASARAHASAAEDHVDALIKSIRIPPRPSLLADLQRELASPDPSLDTIGSIVASDVGM